MDAPDLLELFVAPLDRGRVPYMIVGSIASIQYGEPRYTADIDLTLSLPVARAHEIPTFFPEPDYYCPPLDVLIVELQRRERAHFNVIHLPSGFKGDFYPCHHQPYYEWAMAHRRSVEIDGHPRCFAPPEYVILWKLLYYREGQSEKHLRDISAMLFVQGDSIDINILEQAIAALGLDLEWQKAKN